MTPPPETRWLTVTASFAMGDTEEMVSQLMDNVHAATDTLLRGNPCAAWDDQRFDELYLVLENVPGSAELVVSRVPGVPRRVRMYSAAHHWTTPEFLDPRSGPWRLLSHVALILAGLHSDGIERIPALVAEPDEDFGRVELD